MQYIHRIEWLAYGFLVVVALAVSLPLFPYGWHTFLVSWTSRDAADRTFLRHEMPLRSRVAASVHLG